jgi:hypothetical protein
MALVSSLFYLLCDLDGDIVLHIFSVHFGAEFVTLSFIALIHLDEKIYIL